MSTEFLVSSIKPKSWCLFQFIADVFESIPFIFDELEEDVKGWERLMTPPRACTQPPMTKGKEEVINSEETN